MSMSNPRWPNRPRRPQSGRDELPFWEGPRGPVHVRDDVTRPTQRVVERPLSMVERQIARAIQGHRVVTLRRYGDPERATRTLEPHVLYQDRSGELRLNGYQTAGYSASDDLPAWRDFALRDIALVTVLDRTFTPRWREGYNPKNRSRYLKVLHAA